MNTEKNDIFDGFQMLSGMLTNRTSGSLSNDTSDGDYKIVDPKTVTGDEADDADDLDLDDDTTIIDDINKDDPANNKNKQTKSDDDTFTDITDLGEYEEDVTSFVKEKIFDEFGWTADDSDMEIKNVKDLTNFIKDVIEKNSVPSFANEELEALNEFVADGGDIKTYLSLNSDGVDLKTIDLDNEKHQRQLIAENLKNKGYNDQRVKKQLERYEDAGTLKEEAEDAKELIEEYREENRVKLLEQQRKDNETKQLQQRKFFTDVETTINSLDNVRGIPLSVSEKKQLADYMFKPTADGMTQYQKDYAKNYRHLVESAYFTMKGDAFVQQVKKQANSEAAIKLREKLAENGKRSKEKSNQGAGDISLFSLSSSVLRKPNNL